MKKLMLLFLFTSTAASQYYKPFIGNKDINTYPDIAVINSTQYFISGRVSFRTCYGRNFHIGIDKTWTGSGRGICLIREINATVHTDNGDIIAKPYTSIGTSYSQFSVIHRDGNYHVVRIVG